MLPAPLRPQPKPSRDREFRDEVTRVKEPAQRGVPTQTLQWNRWSP
jgi:hypothetical protein